LRIKTFRLIENKYFETAVIAMILISSLALALEDVHLKNNPVLQDVLYYMDRIFTVIFFLEMCVKWLALGYVKYFTNAWCWLDFVIVMVSASRRVACDTFTRWGDQIVLQSLQKRRVTEGIFRPQFSLMNLAAGYFGLGDMPAFRVLRTLRGLRPLRAMSRMQGLKVSTERKGMGLLTFSR